VHKRVIEDSSAQMELIRLGMMLSHAVVFAIMLCTRVQHTLVHMLQVSCVSYISSCGATGLYEIVPVERLSTLTYADLRSAILGELKVDAAEWKKEVKYEDPYCKDSEVIKFFWKYVQEINDSERVDLLRWMTGLFCLPPGGFSSLTQGFRISKDHGSLDRLPTVSTCSFMLSLPEYKSFDSLAYKLRQASEEYTFGRA